MHELQERYSSLVLAKVRKELKLKDGVVFNTNYEGKPSAGVVKIPVRDTEVTLSDYDKKNGIAASDGSTGYFTMPITKDKAINEIIDNYDANAVPDKLVADRLDSASYMIAATEDKDGMTALLSGSTIVGVSQLTTANIYGTIVDIRKGMTKANIPDDGRRYLIVLPDAMALILQCDQFIKASALGDNVVQSGAVGKIAGFNVIEYNDETAGLQMIAGHPDFAARVREFAVAPHVQDLSQSGKYIGACAVQGREVYDHAVLRKIAVRSVFSPTGLSVTCAADSTAGKTVATVSGNTGSLYYRVLGNNERAVYGAGTDGFTALTSGTTKIAATAADVIEVVEVNSDSKVIAAGYATAVVK